MVGSKTDLKEAARLVGTMDVVFLTSDGLSVESGLPLLMDDARLWKGNRPSWLMRESTFEKDPDLVWDWYYERRRLVARAEPNVIHRTLANWSAAHQDAQLWTDNVDGLHREAGQDNLREWFGSIWHSRCTACGKVRFSRAQHYQGLGSPCCHVLERPAVPFGDSRERHDLAPTTRDRHSLAVVVGSGVNEVSMQYYYVEWDRVVEIHDGEQQFEQSILLRGKPQSILPELLKVAEKYRRQSP